MQILLDYIARFESSGNYNAVWGKIKKADRPAKALTEMTVQEVLNWQDSIDAKYMSEASGRYQIMEDTLRDLLSQGKCNSMDLFDVDMQDQLAVALLKRRGLERYMRGEITTQQFCNRIAREWASMPVVCPTQGAHRKLKRGQSYYAGDGLNKAHGDPEAFEAAVESVKDVKVLPRPLSRPPRKKPSQTTTIRATDGALVGVGGTAIGVLPELEGTAQIIAIVGGLIVIAALLWIRRERKRKFALGDR